MAELEEFGGLCRETLPSLTRAQAMRFIRHLREKQGQKGRRLGQDTRVCESTVRNKHLILRLIFRELMREGLAPENPFNFPMFAAPQAPQKRPTEPLPFNKVLELVDSPDISKPRGVRDRAILAVLFGNGGRRGELSQILLGHIIELPGGALRYEVLRVKGGAARTKILPPWAAERVKPLIQQRRLAGATDEEPLFVGIHGKPISGETVYSLFKSYLKAAGLNPRLYSPHSARATVATLLDAKKLSTEEIKEVGGWSTSQSVERYVKRRFDEATHPALRVEFEDE